MIEPVNGHLLIEPLPHESFIASQRDTYQEIGKIVAVSKDVSADIGNHVFFDSWLAAKYPKGNGTPDDFYWLVKWEDVRAVEKPDANPS